MIFPAISTGPVKDIIFPCLLWVNPGRQLSPAQPLDHFPCRGMEERIRGAKVRKLTG